MDRLTDAADALRAQLRPGAGRWLLAWFVAHLGIGLLLAVVTPHPAEREVLAAVTADRPRALVVAAVVATTLGDLWVSVLVLCGLIVAAWRRAASLRLVGLVALSFAGSTAVIALLKLVTDRDRPDGGLVETFSSTFPSGHAGRAAAVYGLLVWAAYRFVRHVVLRIGAVVAAVALAAAIALSRVYLGVHWPSDVLAGVLLGSLWLAVVFHSLRPVPAARR